MHVKFAHFSDLCVDITSKFQTSYCNINVTWINSKEASLWAVLLDTDWDDWAVLTLSTLGLKDFFDKALDNIYDWLSFFPDRVKL